MKKIVLLLLVFGLIGAGTVFAEVEISGLDKLTTTFTEDGSSYVNRLRLNFTFDGETYGAFGRLRFQSDDADSLTYGDVLQYGWAWTDLAGGMFTLTAGKVWDDTTYDYEVTSGLSDYVLGNFSSYNNILSSKQVIKLDFNGIDNLSVTGVYFPGDGTDGYNAGDFAANAAVETADMGVILANYKGSEDSKDTYFSAGYKFTGVEGLSLYAGYEYGKESEQSDVDACLTYSLDAVTAQVAAMYNATDSEVYVEGALKYTVEAVKLVAVAGYDQDGAAAKLNSGADEYIVGLEGYYSIDSVSLSAGMHYYDESGVSVPLTVQVSF